MCIGVLANDFEFEQTIQMSLHFKTYHKYSRHQ